ncbi:superinfection immunity protein [Noviherbaspirillum pedocola]|uniref:Superinfection immunity protein n=1 Tax=Noviherbaspirillum pedocola TaxID=2801341 RepID=A0A934SXD8_9BURK|nr:superinfection immunity protein [Noviherbaspirillum pedocola]MBK4736806.1 superinfection immunity protein [Noviherbaspirillum pedocola]
MLLAGHPLAHCVTYNNYKITTKGDAVVLVRVLVLMFLVAYGFAMGTTPEYQLNGFGKLMSISFFFTAPALYFLPTYEAWKNQQPNVNAIALVNIFLGWSILG